MLQMKSLKRATHFSIKLEFATTCGLYHENKMLRANRIHMKEGNYQKNQSRCFYFVVVITRCIFKETRW